MVPGTVIPHSIPAGGALRLLSQRLEGEGHVHPILKPWLRLRLDQPLGWRGGLLDVAALYLLYLSFGCFLWGGCYMPRRETTITWISLLDLRGEAIGTISKCQQWKAMTACYQFGLSLKFQNGFDQPHYNLPTSSFRVSGGKKEAVLQI